MELYALDELQLRDKASSKGRGKDAMGIKALYGADN